MTLNFNFLQLIYPRKLFVCTLKKSINDSIVTSLEAILGILSSGFVFYYIANIDLCFFSEYVGYPMSGSIAFCPTENG
jgi:hypothetical protein